jgi:long-chain acyl-CoA synthetase
VSDTLIRIFLDTVARHDKPALFMRKAAGRWESIPARRARSDVEALALGLRELGIERGDRIAILSENRYEWPVTDLATFALGAVTVPIYPTLTAPQVRFILQNAEVKAVVVSTPAQSDKLNSMLDALPSVKAVIHLDPAPSAGPRDREFGAVLQQGRERAAAEPAGFLERAAAGVRADDVATIIYTSGTTGEPKGAMLTHGNIASNVDACLAMFDLNPADTALSFLPLCHIFERMAGCYAMLGGGVTIAYAESIDTVAANAVEVRPTVMAGVPRFYEKVYARVMENVATQPPLRQRIFHWGLGVGRRVARLHFERRKPAGWLAVQARIADRLVGAKVRARVGGRLRFCISGGAPLAPKIMEFFFAIGISIVEGYGLTETSPVICVNLLGRERPGSVGPVVPGVEVKIGDDGEILTRGPCVMKGYFRNDEATKVALRDGWFHTGDVGRFDDEGYLYITDRLKDLLVTAGGKKVAPQPIEGRLKTSKWISEAVLLGDRQPYIVALIVPNFVNLEAHAKAQGWPTTRHELLAHPGTHALYQAEIDRVNADLAPFETVKRFELLDRDLTAESGELTPTLKVRRKIVVEKFANLISGMYATVTQASA